MCRKIAMLLLLLLGFGCDEKSPEQKSAVKNDSKPVREEKAPPAQPPSLEERLRSAEFAPLLDKPYSIEVYYAFFDAPDQTMISRYFVHMLRDLLEARLPHLVVCEFQQNSEVSDHLWRVRSSREVNPALFQDSRQKDWLLSIVVSLADRSLQLRTLHTETGRLGPRVNKSFERSNDVAQEIVAMLPALVGWEGYVIEASDNGKATVALRGFAEELNSLGNLTAGRAFWIFQGKKRWRECLWQIEKTWLAGDRLVASGNYCGSNAAQPGLKVMQAYFTGGSQQFRLVDSDGKPLSGFSLFASYDAFTTEQSNYQATTDLSGEFTLQDQQKKPIFLTIARNVKGINFAFARKMLILEEGKETVEITVSGVAEAQKESEKDLPQRLQQKKTEEIQGIVRLRLEQAREHLGKQQFSEALFAIRLAQQSLLEVGSAPNTDELRRALKVAEQTYQEMFTRKQAQENYLASMKLLDEADSDVGKLAYAEADAKVTRARELWPQRFYQEELVEVTSRAERLRVLLQEQTTPLGKARRYIVEKALNWKSEEVTAQKVAEFDPHIRLFLAKGDMDKEKKYNDLEVWQPLLLLLGKLAEELHDKEKEYLQKYHQATTAPERQKIYEEHEKYHQCRCKIDDWLQILK
jgi:hypothetical protein